MALSRIIDFVRYHSSNTLNYGTVEGEIGDIELNISNNETSGVLNNVDDDFQPPPGTSKFRYRLWKNYLLYKEFAYNKFVAALNQFMDYSELNMDSLETVNTPITFLVDEFVMKFLFVMGFILQTPATWLLASILLAISKNRNKEVLFWGYVNTIWFSVSFLYFIYAINYPYDHFNNYPRIPSTQS
ncbi:conserved Plasmodium protein, unknown function [Babesia microti strain RI]|uniref:Uncharacterized protein n=1 Tax=Babesia microti (strain RI) TaxID=1133968 RepID=I7IFI4_BABMR|nr:conserved Plasmodium protein, unknown function [Babesia microti strain RI]CCF72826.1 conserved Plasmodium protein, unknown function [Babesia microti strain RI]|eukprot:XP_012647435.1 conserved Plasmodium protein, unknown function [Babesia microti strain RI]